MNVLFVPSVGLDVDLLERLANSIDYPIRYKVALNNGPLGALDGFMARHTDWFVKDSAFGNLGVAGSWNECAKLFPDEPIMLIMNEDAWFLPGYLEKICDCANENYDAAVVHMNDSNAYYAFLWSHYGRMKYGTFDENLWPAYYEDTDMRIRHRLAGVTNYVYALPGLPPLPHGKPRTGGDNWAAVINGCGLFNRAYMVKKWGSYTDGTTPYVTPYKDHRLSPKEWIWVPEERAKRFPLWETFMSMPNPSLYE